MLRRNSFRRALLLAAMLPLAMPGVRLRAEDAPGRKPPVPTQTFSLESYGYRPNPNAMALRAGYTSATVHFIDADNILLTYSARTLMPRAPDQRETDDDHTVRAVVIHLPDGKAIRQAEWRLHDRSPYLWPLANGHFLLRVRSNLYSLDPLGAFNQEHLGQRLVLQSAQQLSLIETSPTHDLLLVETVPPAKIGDDPGDRTNPTVTAGFYRVTIAENRAIQLQNRGVVKAPELFSFPFTAAGVLQGIQEDRSHWGFDFHPYARGNMQLAGFTSTCRPRAYFISDAEFFAFGCRGGDDRRLMAGFNLMSEAKWVFTTDDPPLWVWIEAAPGVGRFAMRNTLTTTPVRGDDDATGNVRAQEIRVFGDSEGDELLRVTTSPIQRPGGNFSLAPDGLRLAVLHDTSLEIYTLPPVNAADRKLHEREMQTLGPLVRSTETDIALSLSNMGSAASSPTPESTPDIPPPATAPPPTLNEPDRPPSLNAPDRPPSLNNPPSSN